MQPKTTPSKNIFRAVIMEMKSWFGITFHWSLINVSTGYKTMQKGSSQSHFKQPAGPSFMYLNIISVCSTPKKMFFYCLIFKHYQSKLVLTLHIFFCTHNCLLTCDFIKNLMFNADSIQFKCFFQTPKTGKGTTREDVCIQLNWKT